MSLHFLKRKHSDLPVLSTESIPDASPRIHGSGLLWGCRIRRTLGVVRHRVRFVLCSWWSLLIITFLTFCSLKIWWHVSFEDPPPFDYVPGRVEDLKMMPGTDVNQSNYYKSQTKILQATRDIRPPLSTNYSGYTGPWIEDYFYRYWQNATHSDLEPLYLPIFWTSLGRNKVDEEIRRDWKESAINALKENLEATKTYFTVVQDAEGLKKLRLNLPENVIVYNAGGNDKFQNSVSIPLIKGTLSLSIPPPIRDIFLSSTIVKKKFAVRKKMFDILPISNVTEHDLWNLSSDYSPSSSELPPSTQPQPLTPNKEIVLHYEGPHFQQVMERSLFSLVPRGFGSTSFRMYEAVQMGSIPVYVWSGVEHLPYRNVSNFSFEDIGVSVNESDIPRLMEILQSFSDSKVAAMQENLVRLRHWYTYEGVSEYVIRHGRGEEILL